MHILITLFSLRIHRFSQAESKKKEAVIVPGLKFGPGFFQNMISTHCRRPFDNIIST
jgi:hypothetical protein